MQINQSTIFQQPLNYHGLTLSFQLVTESLVKGDSVHQGQGPFQLGEGQGAAETT